MEFLAGLRRENKIPKLRFSFTYQLGNFREMVDFVKFGPVQRRAIAESFVGVLEDRNLI